MRSKNLTMFLMDGTPTGLIKCTIGNWIGIAYKIPRTDLERCKNRDDLKQSGVYFLFGASNETGKPVAYVGQSVYRKNGEGIFKRLQEHKKNSEKDYWKYAVVFTAANNSLGSTEISFLENKFCKLAIDANRYDIKNSSDPSPGNITEEKESEMEEFISNARLIMWALSIDIFEPVTDIQINLQKDNEELLLYLKRKNGIIDATCRRTDEGFIVLKGSKLSPTLNKCVSKSIHKLRQNCKISSDNILLEDVFFKTPSGASAFVCGNVSRPYWDWKNKDGVNLDDLERS